jgi:hypothetical protein
MNSRIFKIPALSTLAVLTCFAPIANATLTMNTLLQPISQLGVGSTAVYVGHTVTAGTNFNRLVAGGSFNASCISSDTGSIPGERAITSALILRYNQLAVTIPEQLPALRNMPGFENVPPGSVLSCTYAWTSRAQESTYSIGLPPLTITLGGEELRDGGSVGFQMYQSAGAEQTSKGCIH